MSRRLIAAVLATAVLVLPGLAAAESAKVPVKGLLKSGSASGAGPVSATVIDDIAEPSTGAGSGRVLVLTQVCFKVDAGNTVTLSAGALSIGFAASNSNAGTGCQTFAPGYLVPENTPVTCAPTNTAAFSCAASGTVTKAQ